MEALYASKEAENIGCFGAILMHILYFISIISRITILAVDDTPVRVDLGDCPFDCSYYDNFLDTTPPAQ